MSLKSRKLFAILVIAAMMLTLLPAAVFADDVEETFTGDYSASASKVTVNEDRVSVSKDVKFTVQFVKGGELVKGIPVLFFVKSDSDAEEISDVSGDAVISDKGLEEGKGIVATTDNNGLVTFKLGSSVADSVVIGVYRVLGIDSTSDASEAVDKWDSDDALQIGKETITFTQPSTVRDLEIIADDDVYKAGEEFELMVNATREGRTLSGVNVEFYESKSRAGSYTKIGEKETNALGQAKLKISREKADKYYYRAKVGSTWVKPANAQEVEIIAGDYYAVVADTADGNVPLERDKTVTFLIKDRYGNKIKGEDLESLVDDKINSKLDTPKNSDADLEEDHNYEKGELKYMFAPEISGKYVVEVKIEGTGLGDKATFNAGEFGGVVEIKLDFDGDKNVLRAGLETQDELALKVSAIDEDGLKYTFSDELRFVSNDTTLAKIPNVSEGKVVATEKDDRSGAVTVTVTHLETGLTDSIEIPVAGAPAAIEIDVEADGKSVAVNMQFTDKNGLRTYDKEGDVEFTVIAEDVSTSDVKNFSKDTGKGSFKATVDEYGEYNVRVIANNGLAKSFSINFKEVMEADVAANVVMFIGSTSYVQDGLPGTVDVAPFIEDGRTFVPIRFIGEAFGAELDWEPKDEATEKVFVVRGDTTVTITIGEYTIEVVEGDETDTVVSDVAAFIKEGRTFLPLRAIGEILGAEFDWGPKDADTEWVSFSQ